MKSSALLFAAGAAAILLSGKKKRKSSAPSIPEGTQGVSEPELEPEPEPGPEPEPEPAGFQCERMLYNGYCIETYVVPHNYGATWMVTIKNPDGTEVDPPDSTIMPVPASSEGEALDWAYSKIDGWT